MYCYNLGNGKENEPLEREIKWTESVILDMEITFEYYDTRHGNSKYSEYLYSQILISLKRVQINPLIGHITEYPRVRYVVVVPNYSVFYHYDEKIVTILVFWDNRRNPVRLAYKFQETDPTYLCDEVVPYVKSSRSIRH